MLMTRLLTTRTPQLTSRVTRGLLRARSLVHLIRKRRLTMDAQEQQDQELAKLDLSKVASKAQLEASLKGSLKSSEAVSQSSEPDLLDKLAKMDGAMEEIWVRDAEEMGF